MRGFFQDVLRDGNGVIISNGSVTVYLEGTVTLANIYSSVSSSTPITGSVVTTGSNGAFSFYCDAFDYGTSQCFKYVATATNFSGQSYTLDNIDVFANPVMGNYTITGGKTASYFMNIPSGVRYVKGTGNLTFNGGFQAGQYRVFSSYTKGVDVIFGITPLVIWDIWYDGVSTTGTLNVSSTGTVTTINATTINSTTENVTNDNVSGTTSVNTIAPYTGGGAIAIAGANVKLGYWENILGTAVSSAATITPTGQEFHVTGVAAISTINLPYAGFNGELYIIPDGAWTWTTGGNIANSGTAIVNQAMVWTYDATAAKWYPTTVNSGNLPMTGEQSATYAGTSVSLSQMNVTAGDRFWIQAGQYVSPSAIGWASIMISKASGTATIAFNYDQAEIINTTGYAASTSGVLNVGGYCQVTGSGTLVMQAALTTGGTGEGFSGNLEIYAFFVKKQ